MTGPLLRTGNLKSFHPLGAVGNPVYLAAPQLRVAIARRLDARIADSFAIPQPNEDGDTIDWYAPNAGPVVPWSAASQEERAQAREQLLEVRTRIQELAARMQQESGSERQVFGRLLEQVITFPDDEHIYLVNGHPVVTFWGFHHNEGVVGDPLLDLELAEDKPTPAKRRGLPWWLWLLLLLLLIGLGLWLLRACQPVPEPGGYPMTPAAVEQPNESALPGDTSPPEQEPVTELTAGDPAWEEQAAGETDQEYAERLRTRVRRDYGSYSDSNRTQVIDGKQQTQVSTQGESTSVDGEVLPGDEAPTEDIVIGEDGEIEGTAPEVPDLPGDQEPPSAEEPVAGEGPDETPLPDTPATDETPIEEPVDPDAQGPDESPTEPPLQDPLSEPPAEPLPEPLPEEEPNGEPVDPNAQGPEPQGPPAPEADQAPEPDQTQQPEQAPEQQAPPEEPTPPPPSEDSPTEAPPTEEPPTPASEQPPAPEPAPNTGEQPKPPADGQPPAPGAPDPSNQAGTKPPPVGSAGQPRRHRYSSGNWRPSMSLQDPRTGLPLKIEYDMQDGRGKVKLRRPDGSVCSGDAGSTVQSGKAVINTTSNIRCPDGTNFGRPTLECPPGSKGSKGCVLRYSPSDPGVPVGAMKPAP